FPAFKSVVRGGDILTRTDSGHIGMPNLYFNPERWALAYEEQKQSGYVFTPREFVPLVAIASKVIFYELFQILMLPGADAITKTADVFKQEWVSQIAKRGLCSAEAAAALSNVGKLKLVTVRADHLRFPPQWGK